MTSSYKVDRVDWAWGHLPVQTSTRMFRKTEWGWRPIDSGGLLTVAQALPDELIVVITPTHQIEIRGSDDGAVVRLLPAGFHQI